MRGATVSLLSLLLTIEVISWDDSQTAIHVATGGAIISVITAFKTEPVLGWFNHLNIVVVPNALRTFRVSTTITSTRIVLSAAIVRVETVNKAGVDATRHLDIFRTTF